MAYEFPFCPDGPRNIGVQQGETTESHARPGRLRHMKAVREAGARGNAARNSINVELSTELTTK